MMNDPMGNKYAAVSTDYGAGNYNSLQGDMHGADEVTEWENDQASQTHIDYINALGSDDPDLNKAAIDARNAVQNGPGAFSASQVDQIFEAEQNAILAGYTPNIESGVPTNNYNWTGQTH